eukprot:2104743-Prymnesium_polylepis.1
MHESQNTDALLHDRRHNRDVGAPLGLLGRSDAQGDEQCSAGSMCVVPWLPVASSEQIPRRRLRYQDMCGLGEGQLGRHTATTY